MYNDQRAQKEVNEILSQSIASQEFQEILPLDASLALPKCLWLLKKPEISQKVFKFLYENDFFAMKLCDRIVTSPNIASKTHINPETCDFHSKILEELSFNQDYLPIVAPIGEIVGQCLQRRAELREYPRAHRWLTDLLTPQPAM